MISPSRRSFLASALGAASAIALGCRSSSSRSTFRVGYMNNLAHAQPLVGALGAWAKKLGGSVEMIAFPGGPAVMEALSAGSLDAGFLGPTAVVNAYVRSASKRLRVLSGSASGGASFVVRKGSGIRAASDLRGRVATAQLIGSTPDVALRTFLREGGVRTKDRGGDATVVPMANAEAFELLRRGQIDAAWAQEPWASRMVATGTTERAFDERDRWPNRQFPTALLVATTKALETRGDLVSALVRVLHDDTRRMRDDPERALDDVSAALAKALGKKLPDDVLRDAWSRLELTTDPFPDALDRIAANMRALGYLPEGSLAGLLHPVHVAMGGARE